jgi:hypothetical protein
MTDDWFNLLFRGTTVYANPTLPRNTLSVSVDIYGRMQQVAQAQNEQLAASLILWALLTMTLTGNVPAWLENNDGIRGPLDSAARARPGGDDH